MKTSLMRIWFSTIFFLTLLPQIRAEEQTLKLKYVENQHGTGANQSVKFDKKGIGELPFANKVGKILFKLHGKELQFDRNGDGRISPEDGKAVKANEIFHVPLYLNGKTIQYGLKFPFIQAQVIFLMNLGRMEGELNGETIFLIDQNINGKFGEVGIDMIQAGDFFTPSKLRKTIAVSGNLYQFQAIQKGGKIKLSPYQGLKSELKLKTLKNWKVTLALNHPQLSTAVSSEKPATLIPGKYKINQSLTMSETDLQQEPEAVLFGQGGTINIKPGKNIIKAGLPLKLEFSAYRNKNDQDNIIIKSAILTGRAGEKYNASSFGKQKSTLSSYIKSGKKEQFLSKMEYG